mmetsp:Transcript_14617/g.29297  ORF Transcript_14617/g.29297 Transcript_14617/m.29297 type:complete len:207 (+) Transcript_14617:180-800(+)
MYALTKAYIVHPLESHHRIVGLFDTSSAVSLPPPKDMRTHRQPFLRQQASLRVPDRIQLGLSWAGHHRPQRLPLAQVPRRPATLPWHPPRHSRPRMRDQHYCRPPLGGRQEGRRGRLRSPWPNCQLPPHCLQPPPLSAAAAAACIDIAVARSRHRVPSAARHDPSPDAARRPWPASVAAGRTTHRPSTFASRRSQGPSGRSPHGRP